METSITVKNIDHLGLIAGMIDYLELVETIDRLIPSARKVSHGMMVKALILNAMGFSQHALYITPKFFEVCAVKHLLGEQYEASDFNDDSIGRCLEALYDYGINKLFVQLSRQACEKSNIDRSFWHVDSTNFSVEGEYSNQDGHVKISRGYAKDKRFDLKQITLGLITYYKSSIPSYMQCFDGSANDKQTLVTMIEQFISCFEAGVEMGTFIADAGIYSAENISVAMKNIAWIARVPETITEAKTLISTVQNIDLQPFTDIPGYRYQGVHSDYAGVPQRWLVIESDPLKHAVTKTMTTKVQGQITTVIGKIEKKLSILYHEKTAIDLWIAKLKMQYPLVKVDYTLKETNYYCKAGKPKPENQRIGYQIGAFEVTMDVAAMIPVITQKSRFILATNVLDTEKLPDNTLLGAYKTQATSVENSFKFLKDPIFFAESFFVKKTSRLETLLMIMSLSLLVYSLCERKLQDVLVEKNETVNTQNEKTTQKPTLRLIFNQFRGIHFVQFRTHPPFCTNLNDNHKKILLLLGAHFAKYYFLII